MQIKCKVSLDFVNFQPQLTRALILNIFTSLFILSIGNLNPGIFFAVLANITKTRLNSVWNTRGLTLYLLKLSLLHEPGYHRHLSMPASDVQTNLAMPQASPSGRLQRWHKPDNNK